MRKLAILPALFAAGPALAATGPFVSLWNTNFVVLIAFVIFVGLLLVLGVPKILGNMLDKRADTIRGELDDAKALREEAQTILASYERKQKEVAAQAELIVANARKEAEAAAVQAQADLKASIARRLAAAEDQIASAEASAVKEVRDRAAEIAVAAARTVIAQQTSAADRDRMIDESIAEVGAKLH